MNSYWVRKLPDSILCYQEQPGISACSHGRGGASLLPCVPQHTWVHRPHTLHMGTLTSHNTRGDCSPPQRSAFCPTGQLCSQARSRLPKSCLQPHQQHWTCERHSSSVTAPSFECRKYAESALKEKKNTQKFSNLYFFSWTKYLRELE